MDKMGKILSWRTPRNHKDVQKFLGLIQYLAPFLPDISAYTGPLSAITANSQEFEWRPIHDRCFEQIKVICSKTPVLKPIDPNVDDPIWVICDASVSGVGAMYGQGPTWQTCRPAGFMSKKFTKAQHHYFVYEQETLAVLEALMKWEDQLTGHPINIVTDHKALQFFKTQKHIASPRQGRWMNYLERFRHTIVYVKGQLNKVADTLSRYYETDTWYDTHHVDEYVSADIRLDRDLEDVPTPRVEEIRKGDVPFHALRVAATLELRRSERVLNRQEARNLEAAKIAAGLPTAYEEDARPNSSTDNPTAFESRNRGTNLRTKVFDQHKEFVQGIPQRTECTPQS